jgi:SAM-dependent methyltransferase
MHPTSPDPSATAQFWDERYSGSNRVWSGQPNAVLVAESQSLLPGRVLDVGCGEGADAVWLAQNGWDVTALDVSRVALDRAESHASLLGMQVHWVHAGLVEAALAPASFALVSAQYPALLRTADNAAERTLINAVAPHGVLLVVHHPTPTAEEAKAHGFHPEEYVGPGDIAALLDANWRIDVHETRPRRVTAGAGAHHTEDVILRAHRLG